jgi:hypothetical protein
LRGNIGGWTSEVRVENADAGECVERIYGVCLDVSGSPIGEGSEVELRFVVRFGGGVNDWHGARTRLLTSRYMVCFIGLHLMCIYRYVCIWIRYIERIDKSV